MTGCFGDKIYDKAIKSFNYHKTGAVSVAGWVQLLPMVLAPLTYLLVLLESCCSHEIEFLVEPGSEEETRRYIERMRTVCPEMVTYVVCYHKQKRTSRHNGKTSTHYVDVVTWKGSKKYEIPNWTDTTPDTPYFTPTCNTRLTLPAVVHFSDTESRQHFKADRKRFVDENRHRDKLIKYLTETEIPGLTKRHMVCGGDYVQPWWMTSGYYFLAVLLHLTWPFRWKLNSVTEGKELPIVKAISCRPPPPPPPQPQPPYNPGFTNPEALYPDTARSEALKILYSSAHCFAPSYPPPPKHPSAQTHSVYGTYTINPDLIIATRGDDEDAPPTYEEVMGTGGHEENGEGSENESETIQLRSFSNQKPFV